MWRKKNEQVKSKLLKHRESSSPFLLCWLTNAWTHIQLAQISTSLQNSWLCYWYFVPFLPALSFFPQRHTTLHCTVLCLSHNTGRHTSATWNALCHRKQWKSATVEGKTFSVCAVSLNAEELGIYENQTITPGKKDGCQTFFFLHLKT